MKGNYILLALFVSPLIACRPVKQEQSHEDYFNPRDSMLKNARIR